MAIVRSQITTLEALATWMQENMVPNIFKSVSYTLNAYNRGIMAATDSDDNVVLGIKDGSDTEGAGYFRAYRADENYIGVNLNYLPNPGSTTIDVIGCDNGAMLSCSVVDTGGNGRKFAALFAKTSNDKVAVIFPSTLTSTDTARYYTALHHVAFGDNTTMSTTTTFNTEAASQTGMMSFITNAQPNTASYTPKAFYLLSHSDYTSGMGTFVLGGEEYITNGYWAISCSTT